MLEAGGGRLKPLVVALDTPLALTLRGFASREPCESPFLKIGFPDPYKRGLFIDSELLNVLMVDILKLPSEDSVVEG